MRHSEGTDDGPQQYFGGRIPQPPVRALIGMGAPVAACAEVAILLGMGVVVTLEINGRVVSLPDPSGGEFNAAGDFDRLLPFSPDLLVLGRVDPYGDVEFRSSDMAAIPQEVGGLLGLAQDGPERRGLLRLQALAAHGSRIPGSVLRSIGD